MSGQKRKNDTTVSFRLSKRNSESSEDKNPLLKLIPNVSVVKDTFTYTNHQQWETLESDQSCMLVFEKWYNDNNKRYKHIKHAFNSLCKHYGLITIRHVIVKIDDHEISTLWTFRSFNERTWIYQSIEGDLDQIAFKEDDRFTLQNDELEPISKLIEMVCA